MKNQNDIEVKDFTIVSPSSEIEKAKKLLKDNGYFVENLWRIEDVTDNYECTEEDAQEVLEMALTNYATYQQIWEAINYETENMNLKRID